MSVDLLYKFMKLAYSTMIRDILVNAVHKTETLLDDKGLELLDRIFEYEGK